MAGKLGSIADVDIDPEGRFKYILIKVTDKQSQESKHIVRGYKSCEWHGDIFDRVTPDIEAKGMNCHCPGGGRILHKPGEKKLEVFGHSTGYGKADHQISSDILKKFYPEYQISWSDEGY